MWLLSVELLCLLNDNNTVVGSGTGNGAILGNNGNNSSFGVTIGAMVERIALYGPKGVHLV